MDNDTSNGTATTTTVPTGATATGSTATGSAATGFTDADPSVDTGKRPFRLVRSRSERMLGGVCGGMADQLGIDVSLLRLGLVALTILGAGAGAVIYVAAWVLAPEVD
ncbi:PspC domain-containing protein [Pseudonocardia sp. N23]|uniref:PspC domain-containing protein n=1 Tax=Pseudonocardia sp. N23 TaxID=1987376 RepID=UPI000BFD690E|nr:PspC domain-containing protein [Pseudonocardia sp. N23]GAY09041.1 putative stress-responsive transcriptional regulator [Pseudonocardia sp. N23]